jgi:methylthioribulose 1-phosphate dehydratase/enolase-phosphatase E1
MSSSTDKVATKPGAGWSNGELPPSMFPLTRDGKLALYSHQRRWIGLNKGWTRIGHGSTELDARHSSSQSAESATANREEEAESVKSLIAQLCEQFYRNGWATGTGGGVSIRVPSDNGAYRVFVAPSGIQKEDMIGEDVFELDMERNVVVPPKTPNLRQSACTPLWFVVYKHRPSAMSVIHTHSINAQMATLIDPTEQSSCLRITHLEMLKGVGNHAYDDVLEIPIIDNRPSEDLLAQQLEMALKKYPKCNAVLVRRHGLYVWGDSWEQAKTQCESFDYLFESVLRMRQMGIDPGRIPKQGTYRVEDVSKEDAGSSTAEAVTKKRKLDEAGFNAKAKASNQDDVDSNTTPVLPRNGKVLLLDIEGCTTSIAFVKEQLFPYVVEQIDFFLATLASDAVCSIHSSLANDLMKLPNDHPLKSYLLMTQPEGTHVGANEVSKLIKDMVAADVKATGLKALQGKMWKAGYENGTIKGHVYEDFVPMLDWCKLQGIQVYIYSSGSIEAQKLLFGNSIKGDLQHHFLGHFDTTSGSKKEAASYQTIAKSIGHAPSEITFVSDAEAELVAAKEAGIGNVVMSIRPGNVPLTAVGKGFPVVHSLLQLCGL